MKTNRSVPEAAVIPGLPYPDVRAAVDWLTRAFGFQERLQIGDHRAQLVYEGGAVIAIKATFRLDASVRIDDADAHHARAAGAGAEIHVSPRTTRTASASTAPSIRAAPLDVLAVDRRRRSRHVGWNAQGVSGVEAADATSKGAHR